MSVNQNPIAENVQNISSDEKPHECFRIRDSVGKLHERIEKGLNLQEGYGRNMDAFWDEINRNIEYAFVTVKGSKSVSKLSMLVCTMSIIGISMNSFHISYQLALDTISAMVYTMEILVPVLIGILISTGAVTSGTVLSPVIIGSAAGFGFLMQKIAAPALYIATILGLINCLTEKNYVNKLGKNLKICYN